MLYISIKTRNVVDNKENKEHMKRQYSQRGTRREYNSVRLDADAHKDLQELAEKLKLPLVEVLRLAIEKLKTSEKTDFQT